MPYEDKNFGGSLVSDFRKRWRHVKTIYSAVRNPQNYVYAKSDSHSEMIIYERSSMYAGCLNLLSDLCFVLHTWWSLPVCVYVKIVVDGLLVLEVASIKPVKKA